MLAPVVLIAPAFWSLVEIHNLLTVRQSWYINESAWADNFILTLRRGRRDQEGGSLRMRPLHCTPLGLKPAISPNVGNSGVQFLIVGVCVRAAPAPIIMEKEKNCSSRNS